MKNADQQYNGTEKCGVEGQDKKGTKTSQVTFLRPMLGIALRDKKRSVDIREQ
jgi:hypothetical protein